MSIKEKELFVFHDDDSSFIDFSDEAENYLRDKLALVLTTSDFLYVGLYKPFDRIYTDMDTANTNTSVFTGEFFDGSNFVSLTNFKDKTNGMSRSGFMRWDRAQTDWALTTINGQEAFWVRFSIDVAFSAGTDLNGLNIIFAEDLDLQEVYRNINSYRFSGDTTFIALHQSVRNDIVQKIRNAGNAKFNRNEEKFRDITRWDFNDSEQLRNAAKYFALAEIFENTSDSTDGKFNQLVNKYKARANEAFNLFYLSLDLDDDGIADKSEFKAFTFVRIVRP